MDRQIDLVPDLDNLGPADLLDPPRLAKRPALALVEPPASRVVLEDPKQSTLVAVIGQPFACGRDELVTVTQTPMGRVHIDGEDLTPTLIICGAGEA